MDPIDVNLNRIRAVLTSLERRASAQRGPIDDPQSSTSPAQPPQETTEPLAVTADEQQQVQETATGTTLSQALPLSQQRTFWQRFMERFDR